MGEGSDGREGVVAAGVRKGSHFLLSPAFSKERDKKQDLKGAFPRV
jgi:hypothetical protein